MTARSPGSLGNDEDARRLQRVGDAGAMRSRVADDPAADRAGNARAPLQPGKPFAREIVDELGQVDAAASAEPHMPIR